MEVSNAIKFLKEVAQKDLDDGIDPSLLSLKFFKASESKFYLTYCFCGRSKATAMIKTSEAITDHISLAAELEKAVGINIDEVHV